LQNGSFVRALHEEAFVGQVCRGVYWVRGEREQADGSDGEERGQDDEVISLGDGVAEGEPVGVAEVGFAGGDFEDGLGGVGSSGQVFEVQAFIGDVVAVEGYPEVGVFYVRYPAEGHGEVSGVVAVATGEGGCGG
jgi:hypothetical protein